MKWNISHFDGVGSTNAIAFEGASRGRVDRSVIWADRQWSGVGRKGDIWHSPRGNLYASVVLRPPVMASRLSLLSLAASLVVRDTLVAAGSSPERIALKWPNDVLVDGRKAAGILAQSRLRSDQSVEFVVLGIGLNVNCAPDIPDYPTTSLRDSISGPVIGVGEILGTLLSKLESRYHSWLYEPQQISHAFSDVAHGLHGPVRLEMQRKSICGTFRGIDGDGCVRIETSDGVRSYASGQLSYPRVED